MVNRVESMADGESFDEFSGFGHQQQPRVDGEGNSSDPIYILFLPAAWHSQQMWHHTEQAIISENSDPENPRYVVLTPNLPTTDPDASAKDDVSAIAEDIGDKKNIFAVALSRRVDILAPLFKYFEGKGQLDKFIGFSAINSGGPRSFILETNENFPEDPGRYAPGFTQGIVYSKRDPRLSRYLPNYARWFFYGDIKNKTILREALDTLQVERQPEDNLTTEIPESLYRAWGIGSDCRVHNLARQEEVARKWLGINAEWLPTGHMPNYSHPQGIGRFVRYHAEQAVVQRALTQ